MLLKPGKTAMVFNPPAPTACGPDASSCAPEPPVIIIGGEFVLCWRFSPLFEKTLTGFPGQAFAKSLVFILFCSQSVSAYGSL